jgi:hypothetical protein
MGKELCLYLPSPNFDTEIFSSMKGLEYFSKETVDEQ